MIYPLPAVLVSCGAVPEEYNLLTVAWTGTVCSDPADWCGVRSGRDYDKFRETGLTPGRSAVVAAPTVEEAPVSIECRVKRIVPLGTHDMFVAEVVNVQADERYIDPDGRFDLERARPLVYSHGEYFGLGEAIGRFGWSVRRKRPAAGRVSDSGRKPAK